MLFIVLSVVSASDDVQPRNARVVVERAKKGVQGGSGSPRLVALSSGVTGAETRGASMLTSQGKGHVCHHMREHLLTNHCCSPSGKGTVGASFLHRCHWNFISPCMYCIFHFPHDETAQLRLVSPVHAS